MHDDSDGAADLAAMELATLDEQFAYDGSAVASLTIAEPVAVVPWEPPMAEDLVRPSFTLRGLMDILLTIDAVLTACEGEMSPELEAYQDRTFELIAPKTDAIHDYLTALQAEAEFLKAEEKRIGARRKAFEGRYARFKEYVRYQMLRRGADTELRGQYVTAWLKNHPPSLKITDADKVPASYKREVITTEIDTARLKADLVAREKAVAALQKMSKTINPPELPPEIPGAHLTRDVSLQWK